MANISTQLADLAIVRSLLIQRVSNGLSSDVASAYDDIINSLARDIRGATPIGLKNMNQTIAELKSRFEVDISFLNKDLEDFAVTESTFIASAVNTSANVDIFSKLPAESTIANIVATGLITDGKKRVDTLENWLKGIDANIQRDIEGVIKAGVINGLTNQELSQNVAGVLGTQRQHAEAITRTAVSMVSNEARMAVYEANSEVLKGYEYHATIDFRTTAICGNLDNAVWDLNGKGLNAKGKAFTFRQPPIHINCRSILLPVVKSWEDLGLPFEEISAGTRSSLDGAIPKSKSFVEWFDGKSKAQQEKYLGKGRYELFKSGKIEFKDLVNQRGVNLTVKELNQKYN